MKYAEIHQDLFTVNKGEKVPFMMAHCISEDFALAGGIAREFDERFEMKGRLVTHTDFTLDYAGTWRHNGARAIEIEVADLNCRQDIIVYNLVTKLRVNHKPTYHDLECALVDLRNKMVTGRKKKLAIPKIGCGIDGLEWKKVRQLIWEVFVHTDIQIKVCIYDK